MHRSRWQALVAYGVLALLAVPLGLALHSHIGDAAAGESIRWARPWAFLLLLGAALVAWVGFHLGPARASTLALSSVRMLAVTRPGWVARLASVPHVLRVLAVALIAVALARPETFRISEIEVESIDIMIVLDLSKSMEERDLRRNRLDAGQRTIRSFLSQLENDRVGLVVFAEAAMLQCPLTLDYTALDQIVADMSIGDVPEMGTAIGDALALALASLRRSDATSKVVILLSDGDSNMTREFTPREAKDQAMAMDVTVFTILLGHEGGVNSLFGQRYAVNPALLQEIARDTGGAYFRAGNDSALAESFQTVRQTLETSRRRVTGRILGAGLFSWLAVPAFVLLLLEIALRLTRWRRFP